MKRFCQKATFFEITFIYFASVTWQPKVALDHFRGDTIVHPLQITVCCCSFEPRATGSLQEPCSEVGFVSQAEHPMGIEPAIIRFQAQAFNLLNHYPMKLTESVYPARLYFYIFSFFHGYKIQQHWFRQNVE